ncbi:fasciclin domain-containing protein [bacterium]|nr:fasciclin domain-containing protein [bacterium]
MKVSQIVVIAALAVASLGVVACGSSDSETTASTTATTTATSDETFAPTNAAFSDIQSTVDTLLEPGNKTDLQQVLTYHVVPGTYTAADLKDGQKLKTVEGQDLTVSVKDGVVKVNDATVEATDITASNGVVHVINKVLVPPAN